MLLMALAGGQAVAQSLGTYRWQMQPFCNAITVTVTQVGGVYRLEGTDDQCGAATQASVVGTAFLNGNGTIGLGFTVVSTPGAAPLKVDATVSLPAVQGSWRDSAGRSGDFVPTPGPGTGGSPRPVAGGLGLSAVDTAVGYNAGANLTTGSQNIMIGHAGVAGESDTVRIGGPQDAGVHRGDSRADHRAVERRRRADRLRRAARHHLILPPRETGHR